MSFGFAVLPPCCPQLDFGAQLRCLNWFLTIFVLPCSCGSMSHKTKDCMERPRSKGAKWTNTNIAADEKTEDINLVGFEAKRDRWNGYSADEWTRQAEQFEKIAELRRQVRQKELLEGKFAGKEAEAEGAARQEEDLDKEEDKVAEEEEGGFAKVEMRVRASGAATGTVRNLRIREDTAKYLLNLDRDSAYYDPKSRSMREDPNPEKDPAQKTFAGDNFVRQSAAAQGFGQLNLFSVTAYERGQDVHMQATPSQAEVAFKEFQAKKKLLQSKTKNDVLAKYGNAAETPTEEVLALRGTEAYAEYDAAGRVIRGQEVKARSRYEEDVHPGNHTSVWGSWWKDGQWGYACCKQTSRNAYCTGAAGEAAAEDAAAQLQRNMDARAQKEEDRAAAAAADGGAKRLEGFRPSSDGLWGTETGEEGLQLDAEKLKEAMKRQEAALRRREEDGDDRKRGYNSLNEDFSVTAEDMEAYRLKRSRGDDPLAAIEQAKAAQKGDDGANGGYDFV